MTLDTLTLAKELIACQSVTPHQAGSLEVLENHLSAMGFRVWRETFEEPNSIPTENLYARLGDVEPNLCFAGHVDVVPPGDDAAWASLPFQPEVRDGVLYGRGAEDMKGAIACFVAAVSEYVAAHGTPENGSISFLITADEEGPATNGTRKMLGWLKERGEHVDACIVGEPTNPTTLGEMIKIGRRGSITFDLKVHGKQGHVAYPERADNPIPRLVHMLHLLTTTELDEGTEHFPPSNLEVTTIDVGNATVNMIPALAHAKFNIRFNDIHTARSLRAWVRDLCNIVGGDYTLTDRLTGEAFLTRHDPLIDLLVNAVRDVTGKKPELSTTGGTSDARFIKDICPVIEFGTTGATAHMVDECVKVETLEQLTKVYLKAIEGWFKS